MLFLYAALALPPVSLNSRKRPYSLCHTMSQERNAGGRPSSRAASGRRLDLRPGWARVGACPGPPFALLGNGVIVMIVAFCSALAGTWLYGFLRPRLPH